MRTPLVAGNWKMNLDRRAGVDLAAAVRSHLEGLEGVEGAIYPPFVHIEEVARACAGTALAVGGQDICDQEVGAFTGEVSGAMLRDVGATTVLVGHSERRHVYGETDDKCALKVRRALASGLKVCLCIGETLEQRDAGQTEKVCSTQLHGSLNGLSTEDMGQITIAYEPVWAIGTGQTASPDQAGAAHAYVRGVLSGLFNQAVADATRILYGGSVKPSNAADLLSVPDIDGALVGGAALTAENFLPILDAATEVRVR